MEAKPTPLPTPDTGPPVCAQAAAWAQIRKSKQQIKDWFLNIPQRSQFSSARCIYNKQIALCGTSGTPFKTFVTELQYFEHDLKPGPEWVYLVSIETWPSPGTI